MNVKKILCLRACMSSVESALQRCAGCVGERLRS